MITGTPGFYGPPPPALAGGPPELEDLCALDNGIGDKTELGRRQGRRVTTFSKVFANRTLCHFRDIRKLDLIRKNLA